MQYNVNIINVLIAAGIFQGVIISLVLAFRKVDLAYPNRILATALVVVQLHLSYLILIDFNITAQHSWLLWVPWNYTTAIGPLFYLYTKSKIDIEFSFSQINLKFFIPTIVELSLHIILLIFCFLFDTSYYRSPLFIPVHFVIYLWSGISIYYYLKKSSKFLSNHESWILGQYSNLKNITLKWLSKFLSLYRWIWICWIPFTILLLFSFQFNIGGLPLVIIMYSLILGVTYLSYFLGLEALIQPQAIVTVNARIHLKNKRYSELSKERVQGLMDTIERSMQIDKCFKDDQISLASLADYIKEEPNLISFILNSHLKKNFYDFVNHYRIEDAKKKIISTEFAHYKIVSIGYNCGFNSKATFNRVFKKHTGLSPSDYVKKNRIL